MIQRTLFAALILASAASHTSAQSAGCTPARFVGPAADYCADSIPEITSTSWYSECNRPGTVAHALELIDDLHDAARQDDSLDAEWKAWFLRSLGEEPATAFSTNFGRDSTCDCVFRSGNDTDGFAYRFTGNANGSCSLDTIIVADQKRIARYRAYIYAARLLVRAIGSDDRRSYHIALRRGVQQWDNLIRRGRLQYPWELLINGFRRRRYRVGQIYELDDLSPARTQLIALHPFVSLGFRGFARDEFASTAMAVTGIELLGAAYYTQSFNHYVGLSAVVTVNNLDFSQYHVGAVFHASRWFSVGWTIEVSPTDEPRIGTLFFSIDVLTWVKRLARLSQETSLTNGEGPI